MSPRRLLVPVLVAFGAAACTQTAAPPAPSPGQAAPGVTPSTFRLPDAAGCGGEVARFRAVLDNDLATGHLTKAVHGRASGDLDRASSACAAGREGEARAAVASTRSRYGYP